MTAVPPGGASPKEQPVSAARAAHADPNLPLDDFNVGVVRLDFDRYPNGVNPDQLVGLLAVLDMVQRRINRDFGSQSPDHVAGINDEFIQVRSDIANLYFYRGS